MKYVVFFVLVCVALAAAAPQWITTWPGLLAPGAVGGVVGPLGPRTLVAGPTVINGVPGGVIGGRIIAPGVIGTTIY